MFFLINSKARLDASTGILCSQFFINFVCTSTFSLSKKSFASSKKLEGTIESKNKDQESTSWDILEKCLSDENYDTIRMLVLSKGIVSYDKAVRTGNFKKDINKIGTHIILKLFI